MRLKPANVWMAAGTDRVLLLDALVSRTQLALGVRTTAELARVARETGLVEW